MSLAPRLNRIVLIISNRNSVWLMFKRKLSVLSYSFQFPNIILQIYPTAFKNEDEYKNMNRNEIHRDWIMNWGKVFDHVVIVKVRHFYEKSWVIYGISYFSLFFIHLLVMHIFKINIIVSRIQLQTDNWALFLNPIPNGYFPHS